MPYRKVPLIAGFHYHLYNRGVDKRKLFEEEEDYSIFLSILRWYLREDMERPVLSKIPKLSLKHKVSCLAYVLMPNHFHLLLQQKSEEGITGLMRSLGTAYAMYFNRKYERSGTLFQRRFQAKLIEKDESLLQVSKYIHRNPLSLVKKRLSEYPYSSYPDYVGGRQGTLVDKETILAYSGQVDPEAVYESFVEESGVDKEALASLLFEE